MLIRFFKEFDLIGCGGDTQPVRLQVGTLSQSDYRCTQRVCVQRVCVQGVCAQGMCMQGVHMQGCTCRGCMCRGCMRRGCTRRGGGDTQPIRLQVGTLSQSDYTRVVCKDACARVAHAGGLRRGGRDTQPIRTGGVQRGARRGAWRCMEGCAEVRREVTICCP